MVSPDRPTFVYEPNSDAGSFVMLIARELHPTVDGRAFAANSIGWRELPIPLTLQRANKAEGQHKEAFGIGSITEIWRDENDVFGRGYFASDELGQQARELIREGVISGVSADVGGVVSEELAADEFSNYPEGVTKVITKGTIIGVTALLHASFNETKIAVEEAPITAAGGAWTPDPSFFKNPNLSEPTPLTVTADGRVYGHAALWGTCHIGYKDRCVTPPRSSKNYAYFNTGTVLTADANAIHVGRITAGTGHASMELSAQPAKAHYDDTGYGAAFVAAGEDSIGIWFSGAISPDATEAQIVNMRAAGVSGDWRSIGGGLEMVGLLAVNTPGFPVPRPAVGIVAGAQVSLVAAGFVSADEFAKKKGCRCAECGKKAADGEAEAVVREVLAADEETDLEITEIISVETAEVETEEELTTEDCGCGDDTTEVIEFAHAYETAVEWVTDLDKTFLASVLGALIDLEAISRQANDVGSPLNASVRSFAASVIADAEPTIRLLRRSIGISESPEREVPTNIPDNAFESEDIDALLAVLDLDLSV